jgi:hypothetical protein
MRTLKDERGENKFYNIYCLWYKQRALIRRSAFFYMRIINPDKMETGNHSKNRANLEKPYE